MVSSMCREQSLVGIMSEIRTGGEDRWPGNSHGFGRGRDITSSPVAVTATRASESERLAEQNGRGMDTGGRHTALATATDERIDPCHAVAAHQKSNARQNKLGFGARCSAAAGGRVQANNGHVPFELLLIFFFPIWLMFSDVLFKMAADDRDIDINDVYNFRLEKLFKKFVLRYHFICFDF